MMMTITGYNSILTQTLTPVILEVISLWRYWELIYEYSLEL